MKSVYIKLLKVALVAGALSFLLLSGKLQLALLASSFCHPQMLILGIALSFIPMPISFLRYQLLLRGVGIDLSFGEVSKVGLIGGFFNTFMPGNMGGDVVKAAYVARDCGKRSKVVASVMIDRIMGLFGVVILGGSAMLMQLPQILNTPSLHNLAIGIFATMAIATTCGIVGVATLMYTRKAGFYCFLAVCAIIGIVSWRLGNGLTVFDLSASHGGSPSEVLTSRLIIALVSSLPLSALCILILPSCLPGRSFASFISAHLPFGEKVVNLISALLSYHNNLALLLGCMLLTLLLHTFNFLSIYVFSLTLSLPGYPSISDVFFAAPVACITNALPMPGGGIGVGEFAFDSLLSLCRTPEGRIITGGASILLLWRLWGIALCLIGLPFYLAERTSAKN